MRKYKTVHLCALDKFIPPFIHFVDENIDDKGQRYFLFGDIEKYPTPLNDRVVLMQGVASWWALFISSIFAKKIILHSLLRRQYVLFLAAQPWLLRKCYWIMWGADLYGYLREAKGLKVRIYEHIRRFVIRNAGFLVTGTPGDVDVARREYHAKGQWVKCFNYPSNLFDARDMPTIAPPPTMDEQICIMVGNSASPSNNHIDAFRKIKKIKKGHYTVICPLSYGEDQYAREVKRAGKEMFNEDITFIEEFLPRDKYIELLSTIDIVVFNHDRQQALGNLILSIGLGKTVYMKQTNLFDLFTQMGISVCDIDKADALDPISAEISAANIEAVKRTFSKQNLIESLSRWIV